MMHHWIVTFEGEGRPASPGSFATERVSSTPQLAEQWSMMMFLPWPETHMASRGWGLPLWPRRNRIWRMMISSVLVTRG